MKKRMAVILFAVCLALGLTGCGQAVSVEPVQTAGQTAAIQGQALAEVHFLDVGQGDSIFLRLGDKTMLIDAAEADQAEKIIAYLQSQQVEKLDYVLGTHPHADHIGGLAQVISAFDVGQVYLPKVSHNTATYRKLLETIQKKGLKVQTAKAGVKVLEGNGITAEILSPPENWEGDLNNQSIVLKLTAGKVSYLFMGDAETEAEKMLTNVRADVLKVGHHGSSTSSGAMFLQRVKPKIAVISCGVNNDYGHPHKETLSSLEKVGATVYRTDEDGTVVVSTDGKALSVRTEKKGELPMDTTGEKPAPTQAAANDPGRTVYITKTGKRYHADGCEGLKNSKIQTTIQQAEKDGYTPHKACMGE